MEKGSLKQIRDTVFTENTPVVVSVVMIAYNLEKYLAKAIESVLDQKTSYKLELVIGEDCSKDKTREIALSYQKKYPYIINVLLPEKNQGLTPNCIATHNACKGKYIALLDGDDYWTNEDKLQKQIDFLENNLDFSGCAHQSTKIYDNNPSLQHTFGSANDEVYTLTDTITHRKFHTSSLVYRKWIWDKVGGIPSTISSNERAIYPMIAIFGKIKYFKESMCVYRFSGFGLSSKIDHVELETDLNMLPWLKSINSNFPVLRFKSFLHLCIYTYPVRFMPKTKLLKHYINFLILSFSYFPSNLGDIKWGTIFFLKKLFKPHEN